MIDIITSQCQMGNILEELDFPNCLLRAAELGLEFEDVAYSLLADFAAKRMKNETSSNDFKFEVDCRQFAPNELKIKVVDDFLVIHAESEEKEDEKGFVSQQFTRRVKLAEDVDISKIKSSLSERGILTVTAPKKSSAEVQKEHVIPVERSEKPKDTEDSEN